MKRVCFNLPGHAHELTFSWYKNRPFLEDDRTCQYLADAILRAKEINNFGLLAYVFMPDHVHLLIWPREEHYSISKILLSIKQPVSRREFIFCRKHNPEKLENFFTGNKHAPYRFWQVGGGYDRNIISSGAMLNSINYIHNNPLRNKTVSAPKDWHWSSFAE